MAPSRAPETAITCWTRGIWSRTPATAASNSGEMMRALDSE